MITQVHIWTDGSCSRNPGPGGWAAIIRYYQDDKMIDERELTGCLPEATNNRMELLAVYKALSIIAIDYAPIMVWTDSEYIVKSISRVAGWKENGWHRQDGKLVSNIELWNELLPLLQKYKVSFTWVKAHGENSYNNRVDSLAKAAIKEGNHAKQVSS